MMMILKNYHDFSDKSKIAKNTDDLFLSKNIDSIFIASPATTIKNILYSLL